MSGSNLPLEGVRVVDFTRLLPGPWCTQVLGDLGADVIKIEEPEVGDYGRFNPPHYKETGVYFAAVNRNKRSIALDMKKPDDRKVAVDLIREAGILVESFRPGVTARLGIDYGTIKKSNPSDRLLFGQRLWLRRRARPLARTRSFHPGHVRSAGNAHRVGRSAVQFRHSRRVTTLLRFIQRSEFSQPISVESRRARDATSTYRCTTRRSLWRA